MEQGDQVPIFDFPLISDDRHPAGRTLDEAVPGQRVVYDERVWRLGEDREATGDQLGWVTIVETVTTRQGKRPFHAAFDLDGYDPIEVSGIVPGNGSWVGTGRGNTSGHGRNGSVAIEGWNPKSWG